MLNDFIFYFNLILLGSVVIFLFFIISCDIKSSKKASTPLIKIMPRDSMRTNAGDTIKFKVIVKPRFAGILTRKSNIIIGEAMLFNKVGDFYDKFYKRNFTPTLIHPNMDDIAEFIVPDYPSGTKININFRVKNYKAYNNQYAHHTIVIE